MCFSILNSPPFFLTSLDLNHVSFYLKNQHSSAVGVPGLTEGNFIISGILLLLGGGAGLVLGMKAR